MANVFNQKGITKADWDKVEVYRLKSTGEVTVISSTEDKETIDILDKAMEAIDGQRLPPN